MMSPEQQLKMFETIIRLEQEVKGMRSESKVELGAIKTQTTLTNGRVTQLEINQNKMFAWRNRVEGAYGAVAIIAGAGGLILGICATIIAGQ